MHAVPTNLFKQFAKEIGEICNYVDGGGIIFEQEFERIEQEDGNSINKAIFSWNLGEDHSSPHHLRLPQIKSIHAFKTLLTYRTLDPKKLSGTGRVGELLENTQKDLKTVTVDLSMDTPTEHKSAKFYPARLKNVGAGKHVPLVIDQTPIEFMADGSTWRVLTNKYKEITYVATESENIYNYLDKGFYIMFAQIGEGARKSRVVAVSDALDVNTLAVFAMFSLQPSICALFKNEHFISQYDAELLKLRCYKKLTPKNKKKYDEDLLPALDADYADCTVLRAIQKVVTGELESVG